MFRRNDLALVSVIAAAALMLTVSGCKVQATNAQASAGTTGEGQAATSGPAVTSGVTRSGSLIVEPGGGFSPVYNLINGARHSIDVTMYEFSDTTAEHDLAAVARRGVLVHVILDQREHSTNSDASCK